MIATDPPPNAVQLTPTTERFHPGHSDRRLRASRSQVEMPGRSTKNPRCAVWFASHGQHRCFRERTRIMASLPEPLRRPASPMLTRHAPAEAEDDADTAAMRILVEGTVKKAPKVAAKAIFAERSGQRRHRELRSQ